MLLPYAAYSVTAVRLPTPVRQNGPMTRVVIVGGGPGGYEAALVAAQLGAEVTVVDRDGLGGSCVLTDCVPSKTLIATAEVMTLAADSGELGVRIGGGAAAARSGRRRPRRRQRAREAPGARRSPPTSRPGSSARACASCAGSAASTAARACSPRPPTARRPSSSTADAVLVATGARPRVVAGRRARRRAHPHLGAGLRPRRAARAARRGRAPASPAPSSPRRTTPSGSDVVLVSLARPRAARRGPRRRAGARGRVPAPRHDRARPLARRGGRRAPPTASSSPWPTARRSRASHCLMAVGSIPNTEGLGLVESRRARSTASGYVEVDRVSRTSARGVYAAGDVTGVLMLASVAAMQGRIAMWHALGDAVSPLDLRTVSSNVFTDPEIATVGVTQAQADAGRGRGPQSIKLPLATNARAKMQGLTDGFVKLFCRPGTGIVVGGVVVAPRGPPSSCSPSPSRSSSGSPSTRSPHRSPSTRRSPARSPRRPASCTPTAEPGSLGAGEARVRRSRRRPARGRSGR